MRTRLSVPLVLAALLALVTLGGVTSTARAEGEAADAAAEPVFIQMRIWQHVDDSENLWISARPKGGRWDTLGTIPFPLEQRAGGYSDVSKFRYADLAMAGVGLRVWQPETERERIFVQACIASCPGRVPGVRLLWRPLGMNPLPLDDGHSTNGRYRYGDLTVVVPRNPGLLADREHLLALRDVLEGGGTELDWSPGRAAEDWEGITVGGTPPRVTGLSLSESGLTGEIWGYLGALTELIELRLDGNALRGLIPSRLILLKQLTALRLAGNGFEHCVPQPLRAVPDNDLDSLGLPDCPAPESGSGTVATGAHWFYSDATGPLIFVVFDIPVGRSLYILPTFSGVHCDSLGVTSIFGAMRCSHAFGVYLGTQNDLGGGGTWIVMDALLAGEELERSHYSGCVYDCGPEGSSSALLEQLAASVWLNTAIDEDALECTPIDETSRRCNWRWVWP